MKSVSVLLITFLLAFATVTLIYPSFGPANSPVAEGHPVWTRAIRLPAFGNHSEWVQPGYNAQQILAMISDLRPTLLDRYIGGYQVLTRPVPVCTGCKPMDVLQFLQASENASGAQIMAAISLWNFDNGTLFSITKTMLTIPVNPPIRMLSLDDYSGWIQAHTSTQLTSILNTLHKEGWTYIEAGGCGSHGGIAAGVTNYASVCFRYWQWAVSPNSVGAWKSDSSIKFILGTQDFPRDITYLLSYSPSYLGSIYHDFAANQSIMGYHAIYFIMQANWNSNKVNVTYGSYSGTMYGFMKELMKEYNPR